MKLHKLSIIVCFLLSNSYSGELEKSLQQKHLNQMPMDKFINSMDLDELSDLIITDTKVAQSKNSVTQKIEVIYDSEFDKFGYIRNISELLNHSSGQFVNLLSRNDANWGSYAGLTPKYNSYMLNGLPMDSFADSLHLDSWAFEKIEVYRGSASVLYSNYLTMDFAGSETPLVATTNFILKEVNTDLTLLQSGYGTFNTKNLKLYHQSKKDNLSYFFGGTIEHSNYNQYGSTNSWLQTVENPNYLNSKIYGRVVNNFDKDGHKIALFIHHSKNDGDIGRPNREFNHNYTLSNLEYDNPLNESLSLQLKGGFRDYDREFENDDYPNSLNLTAISTTKQQIIPIDLLLNFTHNQKNILTVGTDLQFAKYNTYQDGINLNSAKANSNGFYAQEKIILDKLVFRVGARYDTLKHKYDKLAKITPLKRDAEWEKALFSIGIRYNLNDELSFYANSGTSFIAPSAKQVGGTIINPNDSGQIANPSLTPENGIGSDIGVEYNPTTKLSISTRVFLNQIKDGIVESVVNQSPSQTKATNAGNIEAKGVEFDFKYKIDENIKTFFNTTLTNSSVKNHISKSDDSSKTPFVADVISNFGISWSKNGFIVDSLLQWIGDYYDATDKSSRVKFGSYEVLNMVIQKELKNNSNYKISGILELNNITNREVDLPWGFVNQKINGYMGVRVVF